MGVYSFNCLNSSACPTYIILGITHFIHRLTGICKSSLNSPLEWWTDTHCKLLVRIYSKFGWPSDYLRWYELKFNCGIVVLDTFWGVAPNMWLVICWLNHQLYWSKSYLVLVDNMALYTNGVSANTGKVEQRKIEITPCSWHKKIKGFPIQHRIIVGPLNLE